MKTKIKLYDGIMPKKAHWGDAAFDLYCPRDVTLSHGRQIIDLGFSIMLPHGYAATIQPRSGFSSRGVEVIASNNGVDSVPFRLDADVIRGLVDEGYRGHVGVIIHVHDKSKATFILQKGTRIAQMQIVNVPEVELIETDELDMSNDRGGGFGHTGTK